MPFEQQDIPTSYGSTHILVAGDPDAPPMVLLHSAQASSTIWFPNVEALSRRFRIFAIDLIFEVGRSVPCRETTTRTDLAAWFVEVFDACRLQRPP